MILNKIMERRNWRGESEVAIRAGEEWEAGEKEEIRSLIILLVSEMWDGVDEQDDDARFNEEVETEEDRWIGDNDKVEEEREEVDGVAVDNVDNDVDNDVYKDGEAQNADGLVAGSDIEWLVTEGGGNLVGLGEECLIDKDVDRDII